MHGIDIQASRIEQARARLSNVDFKCVDATNLPYKDGAFRLVLESTMFIQLRDEDLAMRIAREMMRVTQSGAYVLLVDWRMAPPREKIYEAVTKARIHRLFPRMKTVCYRLGALVPPLGRAIATYMPPLYFPVAALFPGLRTQFSVLLQKGGESMQKHTGA